MEKKESVKRFDVKEAAERLGLGTFTLRRKVRSGEISHYRPSRRGPIFFFEDHLLDFERKHTFQVADATVLP